MKILLANINDLQKIPPSQDLIRADTYISVPLAYKLKERGHDISFLCPKGSTINVKKILTSTKSLNSYYSFEELYNTEPSFRREVILSLNFDLYLSLIEANKKHKFDLIHIHSNNPMAELVLSRHLATPFVFTLHGIPKYANFEGRMIKLFNTKRNHFISISNYQRKAYCGINFFKTVYNGLALEEFPFNRIGGSKMLFCGRFKKSKGIQEAVTVSIKTGNKLEMIGAVSMDTADYTFFKDKILTKANKENQLLSHRGFVKRKKIADFYSKSKLTLSPIQWEEPFGLVMIESMACGTPVVAFARGSVPEVIADGKTGFIVNPSDNDIRGNWIIKKTGIEGLVEAVDRIYAMPEEKYKVMRENCRRHVEENFTVDNMVDQYEKAYLKILGIEKNENCPHNSPLGKI